MRRAIRILAVIVSGFTLIVTILLLIAEILWGGSVNPIPSPEVQATIAYLEQNPQPLPSFVEGIYPAENTAISPNQYLTFNVFVPDGADKNDMFFWTRIHINGVRLSVLDQQAFIGGPLENAQPGYQKFILKPDLPVGTHLFEVFIATSLSDFLFSTQKLHYAWVYHVVDD